jgi:hypothetical protein
MSYETILADLHIATNNRKLFQDVTHANTELIDYKATSTVFWNYMRLQSESAPSGSFTRVHPQNKYEL